MESLYKLPRDRARFEAYLTLLQGSQKGDMHLPIAGYNPMGKGFVLDKIRELKKLGAEQLMEEAIKEVNEELRDQPLKEIEVTLNLVDDVGGAWSNRATVDFSSKFLIEPLIKRNFCTPHIWTSEQLTKDIIINRTKEYLFRTFYWTQHGKPKSLKDHVSQETYVASKIDYKGKDLHIDLKDAKDFYSQNQDSQDYSLLFNFFYGDKASEVLNYATYGSSENLGFIFSRYLARDKKHLGVNLNFFVE
ncbi:hypothetical protein [Flagellimonas meridianipacifica]|nr:hypothetical protein [Allomuricauda pacifica]